MSNQAIDDVKNLGVRCKILHRNMGSRIYPKLLSAATENGGVANDNGSSTSTLVWEDLLDDYFLASKQLDELGHEIKSVFSMHIPVPRKVQENNGEFSFNVPQILSTMIPKDDEDYLTIEPDFKKYDTSSNLQHQLRSLISDHNDRLDNVMGHYNILVDEFKQEQKRMGQKNSKNSEKRVESTNAGNAAAISVGNSYTPRGKRKRDSDTEESSTKKR
jgi:hypothetical protein